MGHTKMVAFRIESYESSPVYVEGRYHLRRLLPIDAERISETWDTAEGRTTFNQYKVTNIKVALDKDLKSEFNAKLKVSGTFGGGSWDGQVHQNCVAFPHALDPHL